MGCPTHHPAVREGRRPRPPSARSRRLVANTPPARPAPPAKRAAADHWNTPKVVGSLTAAELARMSTGRAAGAHRMTLRRGPGCGSRSATVQFGRRSLAKPATVAAFERRDVHGRASRHTGRSRQASTLPGPATPQLGLGSIVMPDAYSTTTVGTGRRQRRHRDRRRWCRPERPQRRRPPWPGSSRAPSGASGPAHRAGSPAALRRQVGGTLIAPRPRGGDAPGGDDNGNHAGPERSSGCRGQPRCAGAESSLDGAAGRAATTRAIGPGGRVDQAAVDRSHSRVHRQPAHQNQPASSRLSSAATTLDANRKIDIRVLIVGTNAGSAAVNGALRRTPEYAVDADAAERTALYRAGSTPYDMILLDILLPAPNGLAVYRELRRQGSHGCRS